LPWWETHALELPGVVVEVTPVRQYLTGQMTAQVIGFTGEVSREELDRGNAEGLTSGDITGKFGIEKHLDYHIRGKSGAEQVEVNAAGKAVRSLGRIPSVMGDNVVLTIDSNAPGGSMDCHRQPVGRSRGAGPPQRRGAPPWSARRPSIRTSSTG